MIRPATYRSGEQINCWSLASMRTQRKIPREGSSNDSCRERQPEDIT